MKKLFLLIPALVISMMMSATIHEIGPGNPETVVNDLLVAKLQSSAVVDGDVIELKDGIYSEYSNYLYFDKSVEVRAAEGAHPIVEVECYIKIGEKAAGKNITIRGIKFDASKQDATGNQSNTYSHFIRVYSAGTLDFEDCEFYGCTNQVIEVESSSSVANLIVNNCYFRNITNTCIYNQNTAASNMTITNSTFANIDATGVSAGIIDTKAATGTVVVDHCTFYDCTAKNTDYGVIGHNGSFTSDFTVSNSIFAWATMYDKRATYLPSGTSVSNCLTYNTNKDTDKWGHHSGPTFSNCMLQDPLFNDLANHKYTFDGNWVTMELSPARGTATDGSDLGDPLWYSAEVLPDVDFAEPYQLVGAKAKLAGKIWYDQVNEYLYGEGGSNKNYGTATWKFHATKGGVFSIAANINSGNTSTHKLRVEVLDADGNSVGEFAEQTSTLPGTLVLPAVGDYKVILHDDQEWASTKIDNVTISYIGGAVLAMPGTTNINEAWFSAEGTRAAGKIDFPDGHIQEGWVKWNVHFANAASYKVKVNINSNNGHNYTVGLYNGEDDPTPITWEEGGQTDDASPLDLGAKEVPAGDYILKVTNATQYSDAELISVQFIYEGGAVITLPGTLTLAEAVLSPLAYKEDGTNYIHFTDDAHVSQVPDQWAKWNVQAAAGVYSFTFDIASPNYGQYVITVLDDQNNEVFTHEYDKDGDGSYTSPGIVLNGNYTVQMQNLQGHSKGYITSMTATQDEAIFIVDENATDGAYIAAMDGVSKKALIKRTFKGGMYNTLCIPVEPGLGELTNVFGDGYELLELESAVLDGNTLNLNFVNVTSFLAGRPYLIKPTQDVENPIIPQHSIHNYTTNYVVSSTNADLIGSFVKGEVPAGEDNLFLGPNDLLYFSSTSTPIKGTRAYFQLKGIPHPQQVIKHARIVKGTQVITEIDLVGADSKAIKTIENGQLIITIDGVRYNVMGTKIQ